MTIEQILQMVQEHEDAYWHAAKDEPSYTRHILEHLAKLMGKMGNVVEPREHGLEPSTDVIETQVIPDLLYYAAGLALAHGVDLERAFTDRLQQNRAKINLRRQGVLEKPSG